MAIAWLASSGAALAADTPDSSTPLASYVRARAAASAGADDQASAGYASALATAPDNELIAAQALTHAVTAGDWPLALQAARVLERHEALLPDARFLLVADAFRTRDWRAAERQIEAVEREQLFAFAVPVLRAWLALGSRRGDPLDPLAQAGQAGIAAAYAAEHRPLLQIAAGRSVEPAAIEAAGPRALRVRIAAAAALAGRGDRAAALALLAGDQAPLPEARATIEAGRPLPGKVDGAAAGIAELFVRMALDLHSQDLTAVAVSFARLATWLAPDSAEGRIVAAELLARQDRIDAAVDLLAGIAAADPYSSVARDQRIRLLGEAGEDERALAEARAAAEAAGASTADRARLGEVLIGLDRPAEAALAFAQAIEARGADDVAYPEWALWLQLGGAYDQAGDWPRSREALRRAFALAPDQPLVLNYLGYAQLERRENLAEAERLVREAHRLAPDNAAITDSLGWALFLKGEREEAIALLEQAVAGEPADVEINEHLGDAYFTVGRRVEARFAWAAARVYAEGEDAARLDAKIAGGLTPQLAAR